MLAAKLPLMRDERAEGEARGEAAAHERRKDEEDARGEAAADEKRKGRCGCWYSALKVGRSNPGPHILSHSGLGAEPRWTKEYAFT